MIDQDTVETVELHVGKLKIPLSREQTFEMLFGSEFTLVPSDKYERLLGAKKKARANGTNGHAMLPATRDPQIPLLPPGPARETRITRRARVLKAHEDFISTYSRPPTAKELASKTGVVESTCRFIASGAGAALTPASRTDGAPVLPDEAAVQIRNGKGKGVYVRTAEGEANRKAALAARRDDRERRGVCLMCERKRAPGKHYCRAHLAALRANREATSAQA